MSEKEKYEFLDENPHHPRVSSIRKDLFSITEDSIRKGVFPELTNDRIENIKYIFEISRKNKGPYRDDVTLEKTAFECRLLRITGSFKQAIELCESLPMYSWNKSLLFEYIYSKKSDDYPHKEFKDENDRLAFDNLVEYAMVSFAKSSDRWKEELKVVSKPKGILGFLMNIAVLIYGLTFILTFITVIMYGFIAGVACFIIGVLAAVLITMIPSSINDIAVNKWKDANPEPKLFLIGERIMPLPLSLSS